MRNHTTIFAAVLAAAAFTTPAFSQDDKLAAETWLPSSWQELVDHYVQGGDLGTWTSSGTTTSMWEGIPAGLDYISVEETRLADDGSSILNSHMMRTEDGRVISTGSGVTYWDAEAGIVKASYSGFDTGDPFSGTSTLLGLGEAGDQWRYVETSRGKTTEYLTQNNRTGPNERRNVVRKASGGEPWETILERANPLASYTARFDLIGTWERVRDDGSRRATTQTSGLDGRCIFGTHRIIATDGSSEDAGASAMWWDAGRATVCFHYLSQTGTSLMGEMVSLTVEGDRATMVSRHTGTDPNGHAFSLTLTRVLEGDTMTSTFTDFSSEIIRTTPSWVGVPTSATRTARR